MSTPRDVEALVPEPVSRTSPDPLGQDLTRWVEADLLTGEQAEQIAAFELSRSHWPPRDRAAPAASAPWSDTVPALVVVGYLGAALAVIAAMFLAATFGEQLASWGGVSVLAILAVLLGAAGAWLVRDTRAAFSRLGDFAWLLSVAAVAGAVGVLTGAVLEWSSTRVPITTTAAALFVAAVYWAAHSRITGRASVLQQLGAYGALFGVVVSTLGLLENETDLIVTPVAHGMTLWALGTVWVLLGGGGLVRPGWTAAVVGVGTSYLGASITAAESSWWLFLGVVSTAVVFAASMVLHSLLLTGLSILGVFIFTPQVLAAWLGEDAAPLIPLVLMVIGIALLGVAVVRGRRQQGARVRTTEGGVTDDSD